MSIPQIRSRRRDKENRPALPGIEPRSSYPYPKPNNNNIKYNPVTEFESTTTLATKLALTHDIGYKIGP
jgi:hypothetical protein